MEKKADILALTTNYKTLKCKIRPGAADVAKVKENQFTRRQSWAAKTYILIIFLISYKIGHEWYRKLVF